MSSNSEYSATAIVNTQHPAQSEKGDVANLKKYKTVL